VILWSYQPLEELKNKVGFVDCPNKATAKRLIKNGKAQNPMVGGAKLKHIVKDVPAPAPEPIPDPEPDPEQELDFE